jgi:hypothetical protein
MIFKPTYIQHELEKERKKTRSSTDALLLEAEKLLLEERFNEKNILSNLQSYNQSFGLLDEDGINTALIFTHNEIKSSCIKYRLRFLDTQTYTGEFPYEAILKIKDLNALQGKKLQEFKLLSTKQKFSNLSNEEEALLFCKTVYGNYYLIHRWGKPLASNHGVKSFPMRNFECLLVCLLVLTAVISLLIPNKYLTTDVHADYFSMYRTACFFHVLIIVVGFTVFYLFGRNKSFSVSNWDEIKK